MEHMSSMLMQSSNNTSAAGFSASRSEVVVSNQTVGDGGGSLSDTVYVVPRSWGYMSLENVRPVFTDEQLTLNPYTVPLYGCVLPFFAILTLITNCATCVVLTQTGMRSATGCLLVAIALSDMSMAVWPLPPFFYFFSMGHHEEWVPHAWCYASLWMLEFLPTIFHATSIWLMVALSGQRYLAVCRPLQTQRWCVSNASGAIQCAIVIFILAVGSQLSRIFESDFSPKSLPSRITPGEKVIGCTSEFAPFVSAFTDMYFKVYYCFKTLVVHVIPCLIIIYLSLCIAFQKIRARCCQRRMLLTVSYRSRIKEYWVKLAEVKYNTTLVMSLVLLFLLVETPLTVFYTIELIQHKIVFEFNIIPADTLTSMILFANMSTIVISPFKFLFFVAFCRRFRSSLKDMFLTVKSKCKCEKDDDDDLEE